MALLGANVQVFNQWIVLRQAVSGHAMLFKVALLGGKKYIYGRCSFERSGYDFAGPQSDQVCLGRCLLLKRSAQSCTVWQACNRNVLSNAE